MLNKLVSSIELTPTGKQCRRMAKQSAILRIPEPRAANRHEARDLIYSMMLKIRAKRGKF